ncbi:hypothetical protein J4526_09375 [Desulfurococcaceae archaeon MEX13E-LK6-19]|nr:hypothetical protein J4526_09375 [Desulfurococcaceae archaeon MEX13E-LK6-19]
MSILKPDDLMKKKKELINEVLKDLSPDVREAARRILEELPYERLLDRRDVLVFLKKKGLVK